MDTNDTSDYTWRAYSTPVLIDILEGIESLTLVYKQYPNFTTTVGSFNDPRIYKVVYSIVDGKWHKSEQIEGTYLAAVDEAYSFDQ